MPSFNLKEATQPVRERALKTKSELEGVDIINLSYLDPKNLEKGKLEANRHASKKESRQEQTPTVLTVNLDKSKDR